MGWTIELEAARDAVRKAREKVEEHLEFWGYAFEAQEVNEELQRALDAIEAEAIKED